jgi:Asp-tRNA(Asn)/Glu-tRNA(Gln) amidotransferase A subunit family amidase
MAFDKTREAHMTDVWRLGIGAACEALARREFSAVELTRARLDPRGEVAGQARSFVTVTDQDALGKAEEIDRRRAEGDALGPLAGIPLMPEDAPATKGVGASCSSRILEHVVSPFGAEVRRRIMLGASALSAGAYFLTVEKARALMRGAVDAAFARFDALVAPSSPAVARTIGEKVSDPYALSLNDLYTIPTYLAADCGVSIPDGYSDGLPGGPRLIGPRLDEATLLRVADAFQRVTDFPTWWPDLLGARKRQKRR